MATVTITTSTSITTISGYCSKSQVLLGSNGAVNGTPEIYLGSTVSDGTARKTWDSTPGNGFDSGWVSVSLVAEVGGGTNGLGWSVIGGDIYPLTFSNLLYGTVQQLKFRAAVQAQASMAWRNITVQFYKNGSLAETFSRRSGPSVDKTSGSSPYTAEQILALVPAASDNTKIVATGEVRLVFAAGLSLQPSDLFSQIFVFNDGCQQI